MADLPKTRGWVGVTVKINNDVMLRYHVDLVTLVSVPCYKETWLFIYNNVKLLGP